MPRPKRTRRARLALITALLRSNDKGHRAVVIEAFSKLPTREVLRALRGVRGGL